jgi:hypothetical protein
MMRRSRRLIERRAWLLSAVLVTVVFLGANHLLLRGRAVAMWDADAQFYPYYVLFADAIRAGRLLYWDPWSDAGTPILAEPQAGAFSPIYRLMGLVTGGSAAGFIAYWLLMWWLGGLGMLALARHLRAPPWGGCVVALAFLFCGIYTGHAEHTPWMASFSFLPLIIWRLDSALRAVRLWPSGEAGALWGLSALAGSPGFTVVTGMFMGLWAIGRWLTSASDISRGADEDSSEDEKSPLSVRFVFLVLAIVLLAGLLVMAPAYFAFFYEGQGYHERTGPLSRHVAVAVNALHPGALSTFASPYLVQHKLHNSSALWASTDVSSASIYAGAVVGVLALLAVVARPREPWRWWLVLLGASSLACALGETLPFRGWLYDVVYPTRFFRHSSFFRAYFVFAVSVLALLGTRDLADARLRRADRTWRRFRTMAILAAVCAVLAVLLVHESLPQGRRRIAPAEVFHLAAAWGGMAVLALTAARPSSGRSRRFLPALLVVLGVMDALVTSALSAPTVMDSDVRSVKRWRHLDQRHRTVLDLEASGLARIARSCGSNESCFRNYQLITKLPVFAGYSRNWSDFEAVMPNSFHSAMVRSALLRGAATGIHRTWFSEAAPWVATTRACFVAFERRAEQLGAPPLVLQVPDDMSRDSPEQGQAESETRCDARLAALTRPRRVSVDVIRYEPENLAFKVDAPSDGWLLVTDRWARSWEATVNGRRTRLYRGNFIFRAVRVARGPNRIEFSYHPRGFPALVALSWGTLVLVAAGSGLAWVRHAGAPRPARHRGPTPSPIHPLHP